MICVVIVGVEGWKRGKESCEKDVVGDIECLGACGEEID